MRDAAAAGQTRRARREHGSGRTGATLRLPE